MENLFLFLVSMSIICTVFAVGAAIESIAIYLINREGK